MSRIFDRKLYFEGLRNLRIFGIISVILLSLVSFFTTLSEVFSYYERGLYSEAEGIELVTSYITLADNNPLLVGVFCIVTPLLGIIAFNFCNNRAESDFYFAIPKTRTQIFCSLYFAIITYTVISIISAFLSVGIVCFFAGKAVNLIISESIIYALYCLAGSVFVLGAVLLAISITGNAISSIITALLIIFLPRMVSELVTLLAVSNVPIVEEGEVFAFLNPQLNIPFNFIYRLFTGGLEILDISPIAYSSVVGIIYTVIALLLFRIRKSEISGQVAASPRLRATFRMILSGAVMLVSSGCVYAAIEEGDLSYLIIIIAFLVVSFVVYCSYEMIATRNAKKMVKAIPYFFVPVVANILVVLTIFGIKNSVLSFNPTAGEIEGVYVSQTDAESYWSEQAQKVLVADKKVCTLVSNALDENLRLIKDGPNLNAYYTHYDENAIFWEVGIKTKGGVAKRRLYMSAEDSSEFFTTLESVEEYTEIYKNFPEIKGNCQIEMYTTGFEFTQAEKKEIYKLYKFDVLEGRIPFDKHYKIITGEERVSALCGFNIFYYRSNGDYDYSVWLGITEDYPTAYNRLVELLVEKTEGNKPKILESIASVESREKDEIYFTLYASEKEYPFIHPDEGFAIEYTSYPKLLEILSEMGAKRGEEAAILRIEDNHYGEEGDQIPRCCYYFLTEKQLEALWKIRSYY